MGCTCVIIEHEFLNSPNIPQTRREGVRDCDTLGCSSDSEWLGNILPLSQSKFKPSKIALNQRMPSILSPSSISRRNLESLIIAMFTTDKTRGIDRYFCINGICYKICTHSKVSQSILCVCHIAVSFMQKALDRAETNKFQAGPVIYTLGSKPMQMCGKFIT